jgi:hypothetical protein
MNRRNIISLSAIAALGLALLPSTAIAQQGTLKQQVVGTWTPVSMTTPVIVQLVGANPQGIFLIDAGGRYFEMLEKTDRPRSASRSEGIVANHGTWSVNEADKTLTIHFEGALNAALEGTDLKRTVTIFGDEMKDETGNVWRRAK